MAPAYVGRFAPSPTVEVHLGIARTSLAAWLDARAHGGRILFRVEDVDAPRVVERARAQIPTDLAWLGLDWDEAPVVQSARTELYLAALDRLRMQGRTYPCTCSRREIRAGASAPHGPGDDGPRYPGTCRDGANLRGDRPAAIRLRTEPGDHVAHDDAVFGRLEEDVFATTGDFVIRRSDGLWAYQLAVVVDDLLQGVTCVVRGRDLLTSTPRQLLLRRLLDPVAPPLETLHVPLVVGADGQRLAKRDHARGLAARRAAGEAPQAIVGRLAQSLGVWPSGEPVWPRELVASWSREKLGREDVVEP